MHAPADFFCSRCAQCAREVLAQRRLLPEGRLIWACLHCDEPLDESDESSRFIAREELALAGYLLLDEEPPAPKHGEQGGCRSGRCGVAQPD